MPSLTPNYSFYLPLVNNATDQDLWGGYLNTNFSSLDTLLPQLIPPGKVDWFPFATAPSGYLEANGTLVSRTGVNANLWAAAQASGNIVADGSWTYGQFSTGDLSTTFRILDLRAQTLRGWDHGAGIDVGRAIGSYQADEVGEHTHPIPINSGTNQYFVVGGGTLVNQSNGGVTGPNSTTENTVKNIAGMFCLKL